MTLALTFANLKTEVAHTLGVATSDAAVDRAIQRGLRQFYVPEPLPGERVSHRWSFLKTEQTLDTIEPNLVTTVTVSHGSANITLTASMDSTVTVGSISHVSITAADGSVAKYLVQTVTNTRELVLSSNYVEASVSAVSRSITVHFNGTYALPATFAGIEGTISFDSFYGTDPQRSDMTIEVTDITRLRDKFQYLDDRDDKPLAAAVFTTGAGDSSSTSGTGYRMQIYPIPDAVYRLRYVMINEPDLLNSDTEVPLGGSLHAETILASCLSIAEQVIFPNSPHRYREAYISRLRASVELDRSAYATENLGYNGDPSDHKFTDANFKRILRRPDVSVTVNGTQY